MTRILWAVGVLVALATPAGAVGFQTVSVPDGDQPPLEVGIWYPSDGAVTEQPLGLFRQNVAVEGAVAGSGPPLVVISHGTGGAFSSHYDTALALAEAGFVAAAVTHTGDNYRDHSKAIMALPNRPRHITRVLDYMLGAWPQRARLDPERVGIFGFSAGGFTTLVAIGGKPDLRRMGAHCAQYPDEWGCRYARAQGNPTPANIDWVRDARVKAAVVAAPALGPDFDAWRLAGVQVPIQLWRAADDEVLSHPWHAQAIYEGLPTKPDYRVVPNAGHFVFLAPCSAALAQIAPTSAAIRPASTGPIFTAHSTPPSSGSLSSTCDSIDLET
jgi:predicted dienelactone hydrolase